MEIRIEQKCPQCGAPITITESDRLLTCKYCGVKSLMQSVGPFRYYLPPKPGQDPSDFLYVPYLRFKGNIFLVNDAGLGHKVLDTTMLGVDVPGLPPSLGIRPQAMQIKRLTARQSGRYLPLTIKARDILEKAVRLSPLRLETKKQKMTRVENEGVVFETVIEKKEYSAHGRYLHRAFIGETVSFVYLPIRVTDDSLFDGVTGDFLMNRKQQNSVLSQGSPFKPRWQVQFMPTLCPHCGWSLEGEGDCLVMTCSNCDTAWSLGARELEQLQWQLVRGDRQTALYLGFWKITGRVPTLDIVSFADFIQRTNQPIVPRPEWYGQSMSYWVPAFKLRPKVFLRTGRQATISQWRMEPKTGHVVPGMYPVTLTVTEAKQSVKVILAASSASQKKIFPLLPKVRLQDVQATLVYLPFNDKGHDWYQPHTGVAISKNVLRFGRTL